MKREETNCSLLIDKPLILQGVDAEGNLIDSAADVQAIIVGLKYDGGYSYSVAADNVTIQGLGILPAADAANVLFVEGDNFTLLNCHIDTNGTAGNDFAIWFFSSKVSTGEVKGNILMGGVRVGSNAGSGGIVVENNEITFLAPDGAFYVNETYLPTFTHNTVSLDPNASFDYVLKVRSNEALTDPDWLFSILSDNQFDSAYAVVTEDLELPVIEDEGFWAYGYATFEVAADDAKTET